MKPVEDKRELISNRNRATRFQAEFPYGWDADDLVGRRQLLRWAVMASGALFAATGLLAGLGFTRERRRGSEQKIAMASEVPVGGVQYFKYPTENDHAILLHLEDGTFAAYSGKCTHLSCAVYWNGDRNKLVCPCHEGVFDGRTGEVIAGPPTRPLPPIELRQDGDALLAIAEVLD